MPDDTSAPSRNAPSHGDPSPADISAALDRILESAEFTRARRLSDFLRYVVEAVLEDGARGLKGYTIGVEALGLPTRFDPDRDPVVRVTATRVRLALTRYYAGEGSSDPVVIELPRGSYVPVARWAERGGRVSLRARARALWARLLAALPASLLPPPSTRTQHVDGRDIRQIQQVESAVAARARRPRRG